jgi:hypothetical protein
MSELVEVAIEYALLARAAAFAELNSLTIALPDVAFTPPVPSKTARYLRATHLPAPTATLPLSNSNPNQHYGFLQIDVISGQGAGEIAAKRVGAAIIAYFDRGTVMTKDGFTVRIITKPSLGPFITKQDDPWTLLPVRIPYVCFA